MTSFGKIGKYLIYIQNLLYILCFIKILFSLFFYEYEPSFMKDMAFTLPLLLALIVIPIIKKEYKMKDSKFRYYLCYYSHLCFFYSFWGYFFI